MGDTHLVESVRIEFDFEGLPAEVQGEDDLASRLAMFLRGPALQVIDTVFDQALDADEVWQLDRLDLDLGPLTIEAGQDWEARWTRTLHERLQRMLADLREAADHGSAGPGTPPVVRRRQARLDMLMFFLRHGHMPWYGRGRRADDPRELGRELLRHSPRELAAALRGAGDRPRLLSRLAAQFDGPWLAELVHALLPDEPATVARLLEVVVHATHSGRADHQASVARLWEAVLEQALSHGQANRAPDIAVIRLQLQMALESDTLTWASCDPLGTTEAAWRRLLHADPAWLKQTLQRQGRSATLERRLARALPTDLLTELAGLWLAEEQTTAVAGWITAVAARTPLVKAPEQDRRHELWAATLSHLLAGGGDTNFNRRRYVRELRDRTGLLTPLALGPARQGDDPLTVVFGDDPAASEDWWARLRQDPGALRQRVLGEVHRGEAACRQLARDWTDEMLLEAACLPQPQARHWVAAAIASPPNDRETVERRWAYTLRHLYTSGHGGQFDQTTYLEGLVHHVAHAQGRRPEDTARHWSDAAQAPSATAGWVTRIVEITDAASHHARPQAAGIAITPPGVRPPSLPLARDMRNAQAAGPTKVLPLAPAPAASAPAVPTTPTPVPADAALTLARKVTQALVQLASNIGRRLGRWLAPGSPSETTPEAAVVIAVPEVIHVDNAGLVLIGPYIVRLFEALGLTEGNAFVDAVARQRAVYLLQFAVDGAHEAAAESRLVLNKLLCGLAPETPIDRRFTATAAECLCVDSLLEAVVAHWRILGRSSVGSLRETFLQRHGRLERRADGGWALSVEPGSFDMLLDHLPWGYAMQKLPWMDEVLHVHWR